MEKSLQFTQLTSFAILVWRSMTSPPLVMVASNAFAPLMAIKLPLLSEKVFAMDMRVPTDDGFMHLDSFLCAATTKPGFLLPMSPIGTKMCQQTHSCLMFPLIIMASLGMEVVLWRRFIPALLSILQSLPRITSHFTKVYPMSSESQIPDTLRDVPLDPGEPNNIKSDCAKAQQCNALKDIICHYYIR